MRRTALTLLLALAALIASAQGYRNPVIPGYHPDPSVCRVGEKFYLVTSSFQYFPGVPIYESTDLAHWTQLGHVLTRDSQLPLQGANSWLGIYAPTIRYHEGIYYMVTTNVGYTGRGGFSANFFVTATDPAGPWSEPKWVDQGGIDPSLLFDEGRCYFVSNPDDALTLCEIDPQTGQQLTPSQVIWRGTGGRYPEAPHIYKKDGWYYLLIAEGGTEMAHSLTIARSRHIYGPYEANPDNPILTHCRQAAQTRPLQGTGHGDLVQAEDGSWWIVFLAFRTLGGSYHHLGRETCLAPVDWPEGGWPVVNGGQPIELDMADVSLPGSPAADGRYVNTAATGFAAMGTEWAYLQNPVAERYEHVGTALRLHGSPSSLTQNEQPTFVGRRQEAPAATATVTLDASGLEPGDEAGLTVYQIHNGHLDIGLRRSADGQLTVVQRATIMSLEKETDLLTLTGPQATLRVSTDGTNYTLSAAEGIHAGTGPNDSGSTDGTGSAGRTDGTGGFVSAPPLSCPLVSTEVVGGFTGVFLGLYAIGQGHADFLTFDYREE